jgi:hypothetical protein
MSIKSQIRKVIQESIKEQPLTEAVRFGNKQIAEVMKHANSFRVGGEFEFSYGDIEIDIEAYQEMVTIGEVTEAFYEEYEEFFKELYKWLNGIFSILLEDDTVLLFEESLESGSYEEISKIISNVLKLTEYLQIVKKNVKDHSNIIAALEYIYDPDIYDDFINVASEKKQSVRDLRSRIENGQEYNEKLVSDVYTFLLSGTKAAINNHPKTVYDFMDDIDRSGAFDEVKEEILNNIARQMATNASEYDDSGIGYTQEELENRGLNDLIEDVTTDSSVIRGVEIITKPLPLKTFMSSLDDILSVVSDLGTTDDTTGLHLNVSHKLFKTNEIRRVNFLKMLMLMDIDFMQERSPSAKTKWKERNHMVEALFKQINRNLDSYLRIYDESGIYEVEKEMMNDLIQSEKFRSVNFTNTFLSTAEDRRRVELRYLGGKGYENRAEEIKRDLLFSCYAMLAAVDDQFLRREYLENLVRILNRYTMSRYGTDFVSAARDKRWV